MFIKYFFRTIDVIFLYVYDTFLHDIDCWLLRSTYR